MFNHTKSNHTHWIWVAYDAKDVQPSGISYVGAVSVEVIASSYDQARRRVEELRPLTGDKAGYELRNVIEHMSGGCH